ncbi:MAG: sulfatase-like hydrolase/transferase [Oscillospiraceae bacterium]|nr:sulfatase-like hydrolase/transferase [Oscillospiraceae bacterium]
MRILFIDIDTLRPDHIGCYGYSRNTTPNIDKICADGVKFNQHYCADAPCLPSRASLISGMFGIRHGAVGHGGTAADRRFTGKDRGFSDILDRDNFINIFRKANMKTVSISTFAERHSSWWFNAGFNETYNVGKSGMESGEEVLPVALDWIDRNAENDNWFLHVHLWDPHTPYRVPESFGNPFENEPLDTWINQEVFDRHLQHVGPHSINEISMYDDIENPKFPRHPGSAKNLTELKKLIDGYDTGIFYADYLVGQIINKLKDMKIYDDLCVIISSDHGENMGELGIYSEHATADYATCRIPLIIKWNGAAKNYTDNKIHCNVDLAPTFAELLNIKPGNNWDGVSFADTVLHKKETGRESLVISQMAHVCQRSARFDDWLYIRTYHDGFHLFDDEMLFNIADDPYEQYDIKDKFPDICAKGAKIILDWHDCMMKKSSCVTDPMWTVLQEGGPAHTIGALDGYIKRLRETGRSAGADKLEQKYKK